MYRIIGNDRTRGLDWAVPKFPYNQGHWDKASCLILEKDGDITAVAVYNNWYPATSVEISIASLGGRRWLTRPFLSAVFCNPFIQWGMRRVGSSIAADNSDSIRFCKHLGFQQEGCIREGAAPGVDLLLFGMLKSECRYLGQVNEQGKSASGTGSDRYGSSADAIQYSDR